MSWWRTKRKHVVRVGACSDVGQVRTENQDAYGIFPEAANGEGEERLFVVADGMGGHVRGREASQRAVEVVSRTYFEHRDWSVGERLRRAVERANAAVYGLAHENGADDKMGTTCTALVLAEGHAHIAHVGDSRAYKVNEHGLEQLTRDHTLVDELHRKGVLTLDEAKRHPRRHALTRALGIEPTMEVDVLDAMPLKGKQAFLLCSDGLAPVSDEEIHQTVMSHDPQKASERLVALSNDRGGPDNVTVVIAAVE